MGSKVDKVVLAKLENDIKEFGDVSQKNLLDEEKLAVVYMKIKRIAVEQNLSTLETKVILQYMLEEVSQVLEYVGVKQLSKTDFEQIEKKDRQRSNAVV